MEAQEYESEPTGRPRADSYEAWWQTLSGEDRFLIMDCVRLERPDGLAEIDSRRPAPSPMVERKGPAAALSDFVRRHPEYVQRFAIADHSARVDNTRAGAGAAPEEHQRTAPIVDEEPGAR